MRPTDADLILGGGSLFWDRRSLFFGGRYNNVTCGSHNTDGGSQLNGAGVPLDSIHKSISPDHYIDKCLCLLCLEGHVRAASGHTL